MTGIPIAEQPLSFTEGKAIHIDGFVQERHNSSVLAMELRLSCTNPSIWLERISAIFIYNGHTSLGNWKCVYSIAWTLFGKCISFFTMHEHITQKYVLLWHLKYILYTSRHNLNVGTDISIKQLLVLYANNAKNLCVERHFYTDGYI